jgi:membrane-associated phospholipid phosphatase
MTVETRKDFPHLTAKVTSVIFHPLLMPLYGMLIVFLPASPYGYLPFGVKKLLILIMLVNNVFLPFALLPFLKHMNFISSLSLTERKERKIPMLITTILYATTSYMIFRFPVPFFLKSFILSAFLLSFAVTIINFRWMISVHAAGSGALIAFILILCFRYYASLQVYLLLSFIVAGIVLSSRLLLKVHSPRQVWYGFFLGFTGILSFFVLIARLRIF